MTASQTQRMDWLKEGKIVKVDDNYYYMKEGVIQWTTKPDGYYEPVCGLFPELFNVTKEATVYVEYPLKTWEAFKELQENKATIQSEWAKKCDYNSCTYHIDKDGCIVDNEGINTSPTDDEINGKWKVMKV